MEIGGFGWRELVMVAAALAGIYLVVALLALARLRRRNEADAPREPTSRSLLRPAPNTNSAWQHPFSAPVALDGDAVGDGAVVTSMSSGRGQAVNTSEAAVPELDEIEPPVLGFDAEAAPAPDFAETLSLTRVEAELKHLRADVEGLRKELAELKDVRRISPHYAEAAALAQRGFDARGVADECGISVAEAEFVLAMSRDDLTFTEEDLHVREESKLNPAL